MELKAFSESKGTVANDLFVDYGSNSTTKIINLILGSFGSLNK